MSNEEKQAIGAVVVGVMIAMITKAISEAAAIGLSPDKVALLAVIMAGLSTIQMVLPPVQRLIKKKPSDNTDT